MRLIQLLDCTVWTKCKTGFSFHQNQLSDSANRAEVRGKTYIK